MPHYAIALFSLYTDFQWFRFRRSNAFFQLTKKFHFVLNFTQLLGKLFFMLVRGERGWKERVNKVKNFMTSVTKVICNWNENFVYLALLKYVLWRPSRVSRSLVRQLSETQMVVRVHEIIEHPLPFLIIFFFCIKNIFYLLQ